MRAIVDRVDRYTLRRGPERRRGREGGAQSCDCRGNRSVASTSPGALRGNPSTRAPVRPAAPRFGLRDRHLDWQIPARRRSSSPRVSCSPDCAAPPGGRRPGLVRCPLPPDRARPPAGLRRSLTWPRTAPVVAGAIIDGLWSLRAFGVVAWALGGTAAAVTTFAVFAAGGPAALFAIERESQ